MYEIRLYDQDGSIETGEGEDQFELWSRLDIDKHGAAVLLDKDTRIVAMSFSKGIPVPHAGQEV